MIEKNKLVAPVLKWVGGKRQLIEVFQPLFPKGITSYCEPFLGGGAVLFSLQPSKAYVNDINSELISVYNVIRDVSTTSNFTGYSKGGFNRDDQIRLRECCDFLTES